MTKAWPRAVGALALATLALAALYLALGVLRRAREEEDAELTSKSLDRLLRAVELLFKLLG